MENESYVRTDLALERRRADTDTEGVFYAEERQGILTKSTLRVTSDEGAKSIGKPKGTYLTLSFPPFWEMDDGALTAVGAALSEALLSLSPKKDGLTVLVAGLGNRALTVDAVGPAAIREIIATAHLAKREPSLFKRLGCERLAAIAPGVLGETGIESALLVEGAKNACRADLIIAIDALAARDCKRLATTVQVADTGILPGAGVGNPQLPIDREHFGIPVISVGVPTVVDSATLLYDALKKAGLEEIPDALGAVLDEGRAFFVAPRETDAVTAQAARMIAYAVNLAFGVVKAEES